MARTARELMEALGIKDPEVADYWSSQLDAPEAGEAGGGDAHSAPTEGVGTMPKGAVPPYGGNSIAQWFFNGPSKQAAQQPEKKAAPPAPPPSIVDARTATPWDGSATQAAPAPSAAPQTLTPEWLREAGAAANAADRRRNLEGATFATPPTSSAAPKLVSAGGRTPHSWTVQEGMKLPETTAAIGRADASARDAAAAQRDVGLLQADRESEYLERYERAQEERELRLRSQAEQRQRRYETEMNKFAQMTDAVRNDRIDPKAFFTQKGGVGGFLASIGYVLGAFGGALDHRENPVVAMIRDEVDAQKQNIALHRDSVGGQKMLLAQLRETFDNEDVAENAAHVAFLEKAKTQMARIATGLKTPEAIARYKAAIAGIDAELVPRLEKHETLTQDHVARQDVNAPPVYAGGTADSKEANGDARYLSEAYEKAGIPQALSELQTFDRTVNAFGSDDIPGVGIVKDHLPSWMLSERGVAGRQAVQALKNAIGHAAFGGALSPQEAERLERQLDGDSSASSLRRTSQAVRQALQLRAANIAAGARPEGVDLYEQRGGSVQRGAASDRQISPTKPTAPYVKEPK